MTRAIHYSNVTSDVICRCFSPLPPILPTLPSDDDEENGERFYKKDMLKRAFNEEIGEPWVKCDGCRKLFHQACALFNPRGEISDAQFSQEFFCPLCKLRSRNEVKRYGGEELGSKSRPGSDGANASSDDMSISTTSATCLEGRETRGLRRLRSASLKMLEDSHFTNIDLTKGPSHWSAEFLPETKMSAFIQKMVRDLLIGLGEEAAADSIFIRVVSNVEKQYCIPSVIRKHFTVQGAHSNRHRIHQNI